MTIRINEGNTPSSIKVGIAPNQTIISTTGHQTMTGSAKPWEDVRIEPVARAPQGAGVPAFEKYFSDAATTSKGVFMYSFTDESNAVNEKELHFALQMPHAWDAGDIHMHVHWVPAVTVATSSVTWGLEYTWTNIGSVYGSTVLSTGVSLTPNDSTLSAGKHYLTEFPDISPGTAATNLSSILVGRVFRNSSATSDTYTNKVGLLYIDAHYQLNSLGSDEEYTKLT